MLRLPRCRATTNSISASSRCTAARSTVRRTTHCGCRSQFWTVCSKERSLLGRLSRLVQVVATRHAQRRRLVLLLLLLPRGPADSGHYYMDLVAIGPDLTPRHLGGIRGDG